MSIKIRLARGGRKGVPFYKIVVADSKSPRDGKFIEKLGTYNPVLPIENGNRAVINGERAEYWLSVGAIPSERVAMMLINLSVKGADKHKPKFTPKKKGDGAKKKALETAAKAKAAEEAKAKELLDASEAPTKTEEATA